MKIVRYRGTSGTVSYGQEQADGTVLAVDGDPYTGLRPTGRPADIARRLAPVVPSAIVCIGLNYRQHAEETGAKIPEYPIVFFKGVNTLLDPGEPIEIPTFLASDEVDYECELAVVIGKRCKNVKRDRALEYVLGYTCCNDVSARDWQLKRGGSQWSRGKTFDTFSPLGPSLATPREIPNPNQLRITTRLNGQTMQDSNTSDMIFDVPTLIEFLSGSKTLLPGTVILTGTPHGVGYARKPPVFLKAGDVVTIDIEQIGVLTNPVVDEAL